MKCHLNAQCAKYILDRDSFIEMSSQSSVYVTCPFVVTSNVVILAAVYFVI